MKQELKHKKRAKGIPFSQGGAGGDEIPKENQFSYQDFSQTKPEMDTRGGASQRRAWDSGGPLMGLFCYHSKRSFKCFGEIWEE